MNQPCFEIPFPLCSFRWYSYKTYLGWHFNPRTLCSWALECIHTFHFLMQHWALRGSAAYCAVSGCHVALGTKRYNPEAAQGLGAGAHISSCVGKELGTQSPPPQCPQYYKLLCQLHIQDLGTWRPFGILVTTPLKRGYYSGWFGSWKYFVWCTSLPGSGCCKTQK